MRLFRKINDRRRPNKQRHKCAGQMYIIRMNNSSFKETWISVQ